MKILVKYPTRQRPKEFLKALVEAVKRQTTDKVHYLISYDNDDLSFDENLKVLVKDRIPQTTLIGGKSTGKIHACNRDLATFQKEWDIVVLMSDDMICQTYGWDKLLIKEMKENYPDTDGVLWHSDGYTHERLNTMCILGRKYYERFGYIYHPAYQSLFCDNEFMEVANMLKKQTYFPKVLFKHEHPINNGNSFNNHDELYKRNDSLWSKDKKTYEKRKRQGFALNTNTNPSFEGNVL